MSLRNSRNTSDWPLHIFISVPQLITTVWLNIKTKKGTDPRPGESDKLQKPHDPGWQERYQEVESPNPQPHPSLEMMVVFVFAPIAMLQNVPAFPDG